MNKIKSVLFMAGISLALAFAFSCSSSDDSGGGSSSNSSLSVRSSSSLVVISSSSFGESSSTSGVTSSSSFGESSSSSSLVQSSSSVSEGCEDIVFNPSTSFCYENNVYSKCNGMVYNPTTHICQGTVANPAKCNDVQYNPLENGCCVSTLFSLANQRCQNSVVETKCGSYYYNPETQFCVSNNVYSKCDNKEYDPSYQRCQNNVLETKCGSEWYDTSNSNLRCQSNVIETKCGSGWYDVANANLRCESNVIETKCGTKGWYDTSNSNLRCQSNVIETKCGSSWYDATNVNFSCITDTRDGKSYKITVIGTQTWMAENLNYNASGSKCYDNNESNCATYGRLYNWATAMALNSSCNSSSCASQIGGICPSGWHIPSNANWNVLITKGGGPNEGSWLLKATSGWNDYRGSSGNGSDTYGFSALPGGGFGRSGSESVFYHVGEAGYWWSANEYSLPFSAANAYSVFIDNHNSGVYLSTPGSSIGDEKSRLKSVRCIKD